ncbi:transcription factor Spi-C isoform X1 [Xyrichtys novacula]|uniref:Transcription factor Spi-C n=1 Tax=Xyrichtys novacula TaxID=13765 RepID=A0AAV1F1G2_XYRNO|nr:transcription factor Spi-C isoform X1 [Xyrichtys novacula]
MNTFQESQTDLEVILEFLEEYYRQHSGENAVKANWTAAEESCEQQWMCSEQTIITPALHPMMAHDTPESHSQTTTASLCEPNPVSMRQPSRAAGSGRKVRLFHFLFEMLEDPNMAHCVSWVPAAAGVFRFSSTNKDQVAALWGQRKGNKRPMTYQKMSRALRNYARSGEIFKVKKKLTYQFSQNTLTVLQKSQRGNM